MGLGLAGFSLPVFKVRWKNIKSVIRKMSGYFEAFLKDVSQIMIFYNFFYNICLFLSCHKVIQYTEKQPGYWY